MNRTNLLKPFEIREVPLDTGIVKFSPQLVLRPKYLPDAPEEPCKTRYLLIEEPDFGISVYGRNRKELRDALIATIGFLWRHYVLIDDCRLVPRAKVIKNNFLKIAEAYNE